jgi:hypothetical protein
MSTLCVIYYDDLRYEKLGENAYESFRSWHPDVDTVLVTNKARADYSSFKKFRKFSPGIVKYAIGYEINNSRNNKYNKLISLGADTITLGRLDEFLDDDEHQMLATLDYPYPLIQNGEFINSADQHCNADVICFNDLDIIPEIIRLSLPYTRYYQKHGNAYSEQAGINIIVRDNLFSWKIVDRPGSGVFYNVRAKKSKTFKMHKNTLAEYFVGDEKVRDLDGNVLKVWHYCEGFGEKPVSVVEERISAMNSEFSEDVVEFIIDKSKVRHYF